MYRVQRRLWRSVLFLCIYIYLINIIYILTDTYSKEIPFEKNEYWPLKINLSNSECELHFDLELGNEKLPKFAILESKILEKGRQSVNLSFEDLIQIPDNKWKKNFDPAVQLVYPQAYNISEVIRRLRNRQPINEAPINGQSYRYLQLSKEVCHPNYPSSQKYDLIIVVKSSLSNFKQRNEFRRIYKDYTNSKGKIICGLRIGLVFSLGVTQHHPHNTFMRGNYSVTLDKHGGQYLNPKDQQRISKECKQEMSKFDDIIVGDYEDTYFNLTAKSFYSFLWVSTFCRKGRPTVLFIDDDVPVSLKYFASVLYHRRLHKRNEFFHGITVENARLFRFDGDMYYERWNVLKSEIPWPAYPKYVKGVLLLASFEHVERMALGMTFTKFYTVDDAWIGLVAAKLGIDFHPIKEIFDWRKILTNQPHNATSLKRKFFK